MNETQQLVNAITEGIQDKKGKNIVVADLTNIGDTICQYFIICQGNSPSQVQAIAESIGESARLKAHAKPVAVDGLRNAEWVAMDYGHHRTCFLAANTRLLRHRTLMGRRTTDFSSRH